jgi:hypothetical protein
MKMPFEVPIAWIPASTPPDSDRYVQVFTSDWDAPVTAYFEPADGWFDHHGREVHNVTHWRGIPDPHVPR